MSSEYDPESLLTEAHSLRVAALAHPEMREQYLVQAGRYEELVRLSTDTPVFYRKHGRAG